MISLLHQAQVYVRKVLPKGGIAVDATVGNGNDTLFLAETVGEAGWVYGFDIQAQAIQITTKRLKKAGQVKQVHLVQYPHQKPWSAVIPERFFGKIDAVMFNLGYLPHGNRSIITRPNSTITACRQALKWLKPRGLMTLMLYNGHEGGQEEAENVIAWSRQLQADRYLTMLHQSPNRLHAPMLMVIGKLKN